jgi:hypothetical protein
MKKTLEEMVENALIRKDALPEPKYLDQWLNYYECPDCDHHWYDVWDCQVDDVCPQCRKKHISPTDSYNLEDGGIPQPKIDICYETLLERIDNLEAAVYELQEHLGKA